MKVLQGALMALAVMAALPGAAQAKVLAYTAQLDGKHAPTDTGSEATGSAKILVDTTAKTVDVTLDVAGLKTEQLWGPLAKSAMGPIHLHIYGSHNHSDADNSALAFPLPMGPSYTATPTGFHVEVHHVDYAQAATLVHSSLAFDAFVAALDDGLIVLNIHSEAHHDGEISGPVLPADGAMGGAMHMALATPAPLVCRA